MNPSGPVPDTSPWVHSEAPCLELLGTTKTWSNSPSLAVGFSSRLTDVCSFLLMVTQSIARFSLPPVAVVKNVGFHLTRTVMLWPGLTEPPAGGSLSQVTAGPAVF